MTLFGFYVLEITFDGLKKPVRPVLNCIILFSNQVDNLASQPAEEIILPFVPHMWVVVISCQSFNCSNLFQTKKIYKYYFGV